MTRLRLILRSLVFYWKTNLCVLLAVAVASMILAGALVLGDSVKYTLKKALDWRLGSIQIAIFTQEKFFTEPLADRISKKIDAPAAGIIQLNAIISNAPGTSRANINILGVNDAFYKLGDTQNPFSKNEPDAIVLNSPLAERINAKIGDEVVLRISKPSSMSREISLTSESELSTAMRLRICGIADKNNFGRFSIQSAGSIPLNAFVPLHWLQEKIDRTDKVNSLLLASSPENPDNALKSCIELQDLGLYFREFKKTNTLELRSDQVFIDNVLTNAVLSPQTATGILTYFVNDLRCNDKLTPYAIVSAISKSSAGLIPPDMNDGEIIINQWLADDLSAKKGDTIDVNYFAASTGRRLIEKTARFRLRQVVPVNAADPCLMPDFPGLSEINNCRDWHPGIPIDLKKIRDKDQQYWNIYHGTPKAFITLTAGQKLWANRFGALTAVRYPANQITKEQITASILKNIDPASVGLFFRPVRTMGTKASEQGMNFGQLFLGFSIFLISAALILAGLMFVFGIEKRRNHAGILLALGLEQKDVKKIFLFEAAFLIIIGTVIGLFASILFTKAMLYGLSGIWRNAAANADILFYANPVTLLEAALANILVCAAAILFCLRKQFQRPVKELFDQQLEWQFISNHHSSKNFLSKIVAAISLCSAFFLLLSMKYVNTETQASLFFAAAALLLIGLLTTIYVFLKTFASATHRVAQSLASLAICNAARRTARSIAVVAILASGIFLIIAVSANRLDPVNDQKLQSAGTGGFTLIGQSAIGILSDLNTEKGRKAFGLEAEQMKGVELVPLRTRNGDDASCLNLNRAQQPRILGVEPSQLSNCAFAFSQTLKNDKFKNWDLLNLKMEPNVIPAIGDEATIRWGLGKSVGDKIDYTDDNGIKFEVEIVGIIQNSILQGSLIISEQNFKSRFPSEENFRMMLVNTPVEKTSSVSQLLSQRLSDYGLEIVPASQRLAEFYAVENTYLSIFGSLGGLGLVLGSIGLGVIVLRNALDRSGELAMMRAVGFSRTDLQRLVFYEHILLLIAGLLCGLTSAVIAVFPALRSAASLPWATLVLTIAAIFLSGMLWIWLGTRIVLSGDIINALRNE